MILSRRTEQTGNLGDMRIRPSLNMTKSPICFAFSSVAVACILGGLRLEKANFTTWAGNRRTDCVRRHDWGRSGEHPKRNASNLSSVTPGSFPWTLRLRKYGIASIPVQFSCRYKLVRDRFNTVSLIRVRDRRC